MNKMQIETVGKVFVVVRDMRRCLICDRIFTASEAAKHATEPCCPATGSLEHEGSGALAPNLRDHGGRFHD